MRLTDLAIQKLPIPTSGQKTYRDDFVRGFGVRVSQGGTKTFVLMHGPRRRLKTLGRYPGLSLKEARTAAQRYLVLNDNDTESEQSGVKIKDAVEIYLEICRHKNRERTVRDYQRILRKYLPQNVLISEVTRRKLMADMNELASVPAEQSHAFTCIKIFLNWCVKQGYLESHPLNGVTGVGRVKPRERVLREDELKLLWNTANAGDTTIANIIALCILTGQRRGEIANLKWDFIEDGAIHLPNNITKNGKQHTFPIGSATKHILGKIDASSEYLFPGRSRGVFNGWTKAKSSFDPPEMEHYRLHDLRRTFASTHASIGTPVHIIEKLLNHASGSFAGVAGVYNRYDYMQEMRSACEQYENYIAHL